MHVPYVAIGFGVSKKSLYFNFTVLVITQPNSWTICQDRVSFVLPFPDFD